jgi:hypothetical protein
MSLCSYCYGFANNSSPYLFHSLRRPSVIGRSPMMWQSRDQAWLKTPNGNVSSASFEILNLVQDDDKSRCDVINHIDSESLALFDQLAP